MIPGVWGSRLLDYSWVYFFFVSSHGSAIRDSTDIYFYHYNFLYFLQVFAASHSRVVIKQEEQVSSSGS